MDRHDPFPRRTATLGLMLPWLTEVVSTLPGLVRSYGPGGPLDPRTREQIILAVTEVNGCRYCAWIHGSWQEFLGDPTHVADAQQALLAYARACAEAGRPLPADDLAAVLPPEAIRALRATVAQIEVSNLVGNTVDGLLARLARKRPLSPMDFAREVATVAAAVPIALPLLATAGAMRVAARIAPPMPEVDMPPAGEANLLVHLLVAAAPTYLSNAVVRLALLGLPRPVAVGIRAGRTAATLRIGRGKVEVENGISRDTVVVVEGEVEPLLQLATGSIVRELSSVRIRPS
jgi:alkylhydroperoxidase family enzyme